VLLPVSGDLSPDATSRAFLVREKRQGLRVFLSEAGCCNPGAAAYIQAAEELMPDDMVNFEQMAFSQRA
jgi:hypothetical protein